jgi:CheY-like chemotaxis protein
MFTPPAAPPAPATPVVPPPVRSLAVLVVDDVAPIQQVLQGLLQFMGHTVTCASTGKRAIELLQQHAFDLVITDVLMPDGDGLEVMLAIRKVQPHVRVIAMSGGGMHLGAEDCLRVAKAMGAEAVLVKPFGHAQLVAAVDQVARIANRS